MKHLFSLNQSESGQHSLKNYLKYVAITALVSIPFLHATPPTLPHIIDRGIPTASYIGSGTVIKEKPIDQPLASFSFQRQAELTAEQIVVAAPVIASVPSSSSIANCGDNFYANYIYSHESGCLTHNPNSIGCDGVGQACPGSKVTNPCGYDYTCQNAWFTNYAQKYCYLGTGDNCWEGSYNFWVAHSWW